MSINRKRKLNDAELPNFYTPVIKKQKLSSNEDLFFCILKNDMQIINSKLEFIEAKVNHISNYMIKIEEKLDKITDKLENKGFIKFIENIKNLNITEKEIHPKFPEPCSYIS
tara:strand:- start:536 stop:871 length:336 start_codon:yes stop_codon:yes gene_type:complete